MPRNKKREKKRLSLSRPEKMISSNYYCTETSTSTQESKIFEFENVCIRERENENTLSINV